MSNGRPVKLTGLYEDVTERKLAEKTYRDSEDRFRRLVEGTSDVVTIVDAEGRLTYVNDRAVRITGFERALVQVIRLKILRLFVAAKMVGWFRCRRRSRPSRMPMEKSFV